MKTIHLFYIQSNFHILVVKGIINHENIDPKDVYYIIQRNVKQPEEGTLLFDESGKGFGGRIKYYIKHRQFIRQILRENQVCAYAPFDYYFPLCNLFDNTAFFEEGLSSYACASREGIVKRYVNSLFKYLIASLLVPFISSNERGFLVEACNTRKHPKQRTLIFAFSAAAYKTVQSEKVERVSVKPVAPKIDSIITDSNVLVLDRFCAEGRPYALNNYFDTLRETFNKINLAEKPLYVKLHPADGKNDEAKRTICDLISGYVTGFSFYENSLEDIALNDNRNTFIGSNSTVLFYAPVWGCTNKAISFVRLLAEKDKDYKSFLMRWGGVEEFCRLFSNNVICL